MNNKIEILRSICFTKDDLETITNLGDSFTAKEIEFMVEFKKIYELGTEQLKKFIDKLDKEGKELDVYSIIYYVQVLLNGPLSSYVKEFSKDKKFFTNTPDSMGMMGNKTKSFQNNTIFPMVEYPLGASVDVQNKLPGFMQETLSDAIKVTEDVFRGCLKSTYENDNTLPIVDKLLEERYREEKDGKWVLKANGNYMVKDRYFYLAIDNISQNVFDVVQDILGEDDFRVYREKKEYSAFDTEKNASTAINNKIQKKFTNEDGEERIIPLDLMGDEFDSEKRREEVFKIKQPEKDKEFRLNTNEGQLGN